MSQEVVKRLVVELEGAKHRLERAIRETYTPRTMVKWEYRGESYTGKVIKTKGQKLCMELGDGREIWINIRDILSTGMTK